MHGGVTWQGLIGISFRVAFGILPTAAIRSIAVGSAAFVQKTKELLGLRAKGRKVALVGDAFILREAQEPYDVDFTPENRSIGVETR